MGIEHTKDRRLTAYLLGQLAPAERVEIENQYFTDDALIEYLAKVETELVDAYVRGELSEAERAQFDQRLLEAPRIRARVSFAHQLQVRAAQVPPAAAAPTPRAQAPASSAKPGAAVAGMRLKSPLVGALAAVVVVAAAVAGWWSMQSSSPRAAAADPVAPSAASASATPLAAQPVPVSLPAVAQPPMTADHLEPVPTGSVALVLVPGSAASRDGHALLAMPSGAGDIRIQIDHDGSARERYAVIISNKNRQRVWTELNMAPRAAGAKGVILQLPASALPPTDYTITLSGGTLQTRRLDALADYSVRVK